MLKRLCKHLLIMRLILDQIQKSECKFFGVILPKKKFTLNFYAKCDLKV